MYVCMYKSIYNEYILQAYIAEHFLILEINEHKKNNDIICKNKYYEVILKILPLVEKYQFQVRLRQFNGRVRDP